MDVEESPGGLLESQTSRQVGHLGGGQKAQVDPVSDVLRTDDSIVTGMNGATVFNLIDLKQNERERVSF